MFMCVCVYFLYPFIYQWTLWLLPYPGYYAAVNIGLHVSFWISVTVFFSKYPGVELLDHMVILFLVFWVTSILFSIVAAPIYNPTSSARGFPFLHILTNTCYFLSFLATLLMWSHIWYFDQSILIRELHVDLALFKIDMENWRA